MCDESWALSFAEAKKSVNKQFNYYYYCGICLGLYLFWVGSTAIGALAGPFMGDITHYGFDMAFVAVFLVLLKGMWKGIRAAIPWLVSLVVAVISYQLFAGAWYVLCGTSAGLLIAFMMIDND